MSFDAIIGQENNKNFLNRAMERDRLSHAYLFTGEKGTGKTTMARIFSMGILCTGSKPHPCGVCLSCRQIKSENSNHPDLKWVEPTGSSIKIKTVREVTSDIVFEPYQGDMKVYVFDEIDKMTEAAQNALLKTLEEPPSHTVLIMTADNESGILSTVWSRSIILHFAPISMVEVMHAMEINNAEPDKVWAKVSGGVPGLAIELSKSDDAVKARELAFEIISNIREGDIVNIWSYVDILSAKDINLDYIFDMLEIILRDMFVWKISTDHKSIINIDRKELLEERSRYFTSARIKDMIEAVEYAREGLSGNANKSLVIENLFFKMVGRS